MLTTNEVIDEADEVIEHEEDGQADHEDVVILLMLNLPEVAQDR